jgi:hypothetical protein
MQKVADRQSRIEADGHSPLLIYKFSPKKLPIGDREFFKSMLKVLINVYDF